MDALELTEKIKPHAVDICKKSNGGCEKSKRVIELHKMVVTHPDIPTIALCKCAFDDWAKQYT